jgi:hypothetical protein
VRDIPASYLETVLSDPAASLVAVPGRAGAVVALASLFPGWAAPPNWACWWKTPGSATGSDATSSRT